MKRFPCKKCLVRACCSEYCSDLEFDARVIDIHILSLKQCPDCGSSVNLGSPLNKTTRICYQCLKVFRQDSFRKINSPIAIVKKSHNTFISSNFSMNSKGHNIITNLSDPCKQTPLSMEETHDVLYHRLPMIEALYIIRRSNLKIKSSIIKSPRKKKPIKMPPWINDYKIIGGVLKEAKSSSQPIFVK